MDARSAEMEMMENMLLIGCCRGRRGNSDVIMYKIRVKFCYAEEKKLAETGIQRKW
jgi:hypothetical protein